MNLISKAIRMVCGGYNKSIAVYATSEILPLNLDYSV